MPQTQTSHRLVLRMAEANDRETLYRLRHEIYAHELGQHAINAEGRLTDSLDDYNVYIVGCAGAEIAGFISITPPGHGRYSIDKYVRRDELPFAVDNGLYEMRLLTVLPAHRRTRVAFLLMYAAVVWIWSQGGTRIVAIGRNEIKDLYCRVDCDTVVARCREKNLFLRNPAVTSPRPGTHALRIAVKDAATNARMLAILADVLNG